MSRGERVLIGPTRGRHISPSEPPGRRIGKKTYSTPFESEETNPSPEPLQGGAPLLEILDTALQILSPPAPESVKREFGLCGVVINRRRSCDREGGATEYTSQERTRDTPEMRQGALSLPQKGNKSRADSHHCSQGGDRCSHSCFAASLRLSLQ